MAPEQMPRKTQDEKIVTAAVLIIGNEILSGRTKDLNLGFLAEELTKLGVRLREARVVAAQRLQRPARLFLHVRNESFAAVSDAQRAARARRKRHAHQQMLEVRGIDHVVRNRRSCCRRWPTDLCGRCDLARR